LDGWWAVARAIAETGFRAAFRMRFAGTEHIPAAGGGVITYNHISVLDPLFVAIAAAERGRAVHFLAVADVFEQPLVGRVMRLLKQIPLRRGAGDWGAIEEAAAKLRAGSLTGLSPEGTVGDGARLGPGQKGAARIALAAGVPVVPVGIWGSHQRWPQAGFRFGRPYRPTVALAFGPPILVEGDPRSRPDVRRLTDEIMAEIARLSGEARRGAV
jgi:1-acyl-sn-glycerol-3-phosphate acyltransferase